MFECTEAILECRVQHHQQYKTSRTIEDNKIGVLFWSIDVIYPFLEIRNGIFNVMK